MLRNLQVLVSIHSVCQVPWSDVFCSQRAPVLLSTLQYCVSVFTLGDEKPKLSHVFCAFAVWSCILMCIYVGNIAY